VSGQSNFARAPAFRRSAAISPFSSLLQKGDSANLSTNYASKTVAITLPFRIGRDAMQFQYIWENLQ
jgi:hypothetical protein